LFPLQYQRQKASVTIAVSAGVTVGLKFMTQNDCKRQCRNWASRLTSHYTTPPFRYR